MNATVTAEKLLATLSSDPLVASGAALAVGCTCLVTYFASSLTRVEKGKKVALRALKARWRRPRRRWRTPTAKLTRRSVRYCSPSFIASVARRRPRPRTWRSSALRVLTPAELAAAVPSQRARELMMILLIHGARRREDGQARVGPLRDVQPRAGHPPEQLQGHAPLGSHAPEIGQARREPEEAGLAQPNGNPRADGRVPARSRRILGSRAANTLYSTHSERSVRTCPCRGRGSSPSGWAGPSARCRGGGARGACRAPSRPPSRSAP